MEITEQQLGQLEYLLSRNVARVVQDTLLAWRQEVTSPAEAAEVENPDERQLRQRIGPLLYDIFERGGSVHRSELSQLGIKYYGNARGMGGFATGSNPSIRSEGEMRLLTERGKSLAQYWWKRWGKDERGE